MDTRGTQAQLDRRQLYRGVAEMLAGALEGEGREAFLAAQELRINRIAPAPSSTRTRDYLKANVVR